MTKSIEQCTGPEEPRLNKTWFSTPTDWNCPVCKRHKTELIRPDNSGALFASLEDHHDHISNYIKDHSRQIIKDRRPDNNINGDEGHFLKRRITPFLERFKRTLICGDCNSADSAAKNILNDVCKYFSFSPKDIAKFIEVTPNCAHKIIQAKVTEVYINLEQMHAHIKVQADTSIENALLNNLIWAEPLSGPSASHYRTLSRAASSFEDNNPNDWNTIWKGPDKNLGPSSSDKKAAKERKRELRKKIRKEKTLKGTPKNTLANAGKPWSGEDHQRLLMAHEEKKKVYEIAVELQRSDIAISARLELYGRTPNYY
ncbi:MAG: hypothetical protein COB49_12525 [Alphaproteobacteria bacterium]|nr:MAG: hypothetical protein COB49_12525 [Alphaproteobacteria bacterium]